MRIRRRIANGQAHLKQTQEPHALATKLKAGGSRSGIYEKILKVGQGSVRITEFIDGDTHAICQ